MKRKICPGCERPEKVCLCDQIKRIENYHPVTILRHKSEAKHALNTVKLLEKSLSDISVYDGENFPENSISLLENSVLVYPSEDVQDLNSLNTDTKTNFVFLDGNWKKTRKILYLNPWLEKFPKVQLPFQGSRYFLRKQKDNGFSTLEAVHTVLSALENDDIKYQGLLDILDRLMELQSSYINPELLMDHYGERLAKTSSGKHDSKAVSLCGHSSPDGKPLHPKTQ